MPLNVLQCTEQPLQQERITQPKMFKSAMVEKHWCDWVARCWGFYYKTKTEGNETGGQPATSALGTYTEDHMIEEV